MSKSIAGRIPVVAAFVLILCLAFSKDEAVRVQFLGTGHAAAEAAAEGRPAPGEEVGAKRTK